MEHRIKKPPRNTQKTLSSKKKKKNTRREVKQERGNQGKRLDNPTSGFGMKQESLKNRRKRKRATEKRKPAERQQKT